MADVANAESLTTQASGSVGGVVFARNQHGPYTRARTTPVDPASALQLAVRAALSQCVTAWNATLTQAEREAWDRYALALRQTSPIGRRTNVGGLGMYIRSNVPRIQANEVALPRVDAAPSLLDLGPHTGVTRVVLNIVSDTLHVFFAQTDAWPALSGAALLFYASAPQVLTRNFWKGPYQYAGPVLGNPAPPPTSPATVPLPLPAALNERVFARYRLTLPDARLSSSVRLPADYVPQVAPQCIKVRATPVFPNLHVTATFDHLLEGTALAVGPWTIRYANWTWPVASVTVDGADLLIIGTRGIPRVMLNRLIFNPPPADVIALLTSIPAAFFSVPIPFG